MVKSIKQIVDAAATSRPMFESGESWINIGMWTLVLCVLGVWSGRPLYYFATFMTVPLRVCAIRAPVFNTNLALCLVVIGLLLDI
jgi:hypothetical protein